MATRTTQDERARYDAEALRTLVEHIYRSYGFDDADSRIIADSLIFTDLHGIDSHGVQRLSMYDRKMSRGKVRVHAKPEVVRQTPVSAVIDAHFAMGQLTGAKAMELAIEKASTSGIGMVVARRSNHYGAAGYYASMAADKGLIGISMTNTTPGVLPLNAVQPFLGTNPIAFAVPADPHPFFFDAATSCVAAGKVELYAKKHEPLPATWLVDRQYRTVTDAEAAVPKMDAKTGEIGLVPLGGVEETTGGHKGYGFSLIVEFLTGILAQGDTSADSKEQDNNTALCHSFIAIDPALFADADAIRRSFSAYLDRIRALPAVAGRTIYIHGDKEQIAYVDRSAHGIPLYEQTVDEIRAIARRFALDDAALTPLTANDERTR